METLDINKEQVKQDLLEAFIAAERVAEKLAACQREYDEAEEKLTNLSTIARDVLDEDARKDVIREAYKELGRSAEDAERAIEEVAAAVEVMRAMRAEWERIRSEALLETATDAG